MPSPTTRRQLLPVLLAVLLATAAVVTILLFDVSIGDDPLGLEAPPTADEPSDAAPTFVINPEVEVTELPGFENGDPSERAPSSTLDGSIEVSEQYAFQGTRSKLTRVQSPGGFSYSRVQAEVDWREGDEIWYGAAFYLEPGFNQAQGDGSVDILRWDNWEEHPYETDHGGLAVLSDGSLGLISEQLGVTSWNLLLGPYDLPEGEWVWLEVRQRFSQTDGQAINEVWMDGDRLGASDAANYFGRPITRHRVGIIGTPNPQPGELILYLDYAVVADDGPIVEEHDSAGGA